MISQDLSKSNIQLVLTINEGKSRENKNDESQWIKKSEKTYPTHL